MVAIKARRPLLLVKTNHYFYLVGFSELESTTILINLILVFINYFIGWRNLFNILYSMLSHHNMLHMQSISLCLTLNPLI